MKFLPPSYKIVARKIPIYDEWSYILVQRKNNVERELSTSLSHKFQWKAAWVLWFRSLRQKASLVAQLSNINQPDEFCHTE